MSRRAWLVGEGGAREISVDEAAQYKGPGFIWIHMECAGDEELGLLRQAGIPEVAAHALIASETRPRCDRIDDGAIVNLRGLAAGDVETSDRLVSIRCWVGKDRVNSVSRRQLSATAKVIDRAQEGMLRDSGDIVAAFAAYISKELDPEVAALGDALDDCETELDGRYPYGLRRRIAPIRSEAIAYRRFIAPNHAALAELAALDFEWLHKDDRIHIREAADRFARMAEELEAVRERAALLHEQITDLRSEQLDSRSLLISIVALIFLPLTFITGLLGMNVDGIPYAHHPHAFWWITGFCVAVSLGVALYFIKKRWVGRS